MLYRSLTEILHRWQQRAADELRATGKGAEFELAQFLRHFITGLLLSLLISVLVSCNNQSTQPDFSTNAPLRIYWNRGLYPAEDQALQKVVTEWEQKTKIPVQLSFFSSDDILNRTAIALESEQSPDIVFAHRADYTVEPRWALEGKLVDVSDILQPVQQKYHPSALKAAFLYNKAEQKRSYYGVPIELQMVHMHYWKDTLTQIGLKETDIPNDWNEFWSFWKQAQDRVRQNDQQTNFSDNESVDSSEHRIYGLGLPLSTRASDTYFLFEQILEAYDVEVLDLQGKLRLSNPSVRQNIIAVVKWLSQLYQDQYVPPEAVNWVDPDNNVSFLNRNTLMTVNPSLSIPASQRNDRQLYLNKIGTRGLPNKPDGEPMSYLVSIKQALIFKTGQNTTAAKDFLKDFTQPQRLIDYLKDAGGRSLPTMPEALENPFWKDSTDPHIVAAVQQFTQHPIRLFYNILNPAYSQVLAENVWGQTIHAVLQEGKSAEVAVDEAIARINKIFADWETRVEQ